MISVLVYFLNKIFKINIYKYMNINCFANPPSVNNIVQH